MDNDKISVIVPVFNVDKYLRKCIEGVVKQNYKLLEIILVDDGSTDLSGRICDEYGRKDNRIVVVHKVNGGLSSARNSGLDICTGEYITFVDSDDIIHPNMIRTMVQTVKENKADIVEVDFNKGDGSDKSVKRFLNSSRNKSKILGRYNKEKALKNFLDYQTAVMAWGKLFKASLFEKVRFPEGSLHEDEATIPYVVDGCQCYCVVGEKLYYYTQRSNSIVHSQFDERYLVIIYIYGLRRRYFRNKYQGKYTDTIDYHYFYAVKDLEDKISDRCLRYQVKRLRVKLERKLLFSMSQPMMNKLKVLKKLIIK